MAKSRKAVDFDPKERTDNLIRLCQESYDKIYADVERGVDLESVGSDRRNEINAIKEGIDALEYLVAKVSKLTANIERDNYGGEKKEWGSRTEELNN
jgi:hypothetical protein